MTSAPDDPAAWVDYAMEDLELARRALAPPRAMPRGAFYHAQQSAEKFLKAFLVFRRATFPRVHDLEYLLRRCVELDAGFEALAQDCEVLNEYGVPVRYPPEDEPVPGSEQGRNALTIASRIADFVQSRLGER
jgi:HEPN domain-containing protein